MNHFGTVFALSVAFLAAAAPAIAVQAPPAIDSLLTEDMIHDLRDPFQIPASQIAKKDTSTKTELELVQIRDFKLNGVISGPKKVRAMVTAPNGKTYFISMGEHMGIRDGRVTSITSDSVKVMEYETDERGRRIPEIFELRLNGEVVSLSKKEDE